MKLQFISTTIVSLTLIHAGAAVSFPNILTKHFVGNTIAYYASIAALTTPLGSVVTSLLTDRIGRKHTLLILQALTIATWVLIAFVYTDGIIFYGSSVVTGMTRGAITSHCPTYISEITHSDFRQMFLSFCTLYFTLGYCIITLFNLWLTSQDVAWCFAVIFTIIAIFVAVFVSESPHWLAVIKSDITKAKTTLRKYNAKADMFDKEWTILHRKIKSSDDHGVQTTFNMIKSPAVYKPSIILIILLLFQQLCGIYPLSAYTILVLPRISRALGAPYKAEIFVIIGAIRLIISIVTTIFLSKFNQKQLLSFSSIGMVVTCLPIIVFTVLGTPEHEHEILWSDWILVISFVMFIAVSCIGVMGIPWTIIFELLPTEVRGTLGPYFVAFGYVVMSGLLRIFPVVLQSFGIVYIFMLLAMINIAGSIFIHYYIPETRGKSLYEIENQFACKTTDKC